MQQMPLFSTQADLGTRAAVMLAFSLLYLLVLAVNLGLLLHDRVSPSVQQTLVNKLVALAAAYNIALTSMVTPVIVLFFSGGSGM